MQESDQNIIKLTLKICDNMFTQLAVRFNDIQYLLPRECTLQSCLKIII